MKPFFGINLTHDKKNQTQNGEELLVATPSAGLTESLERSSQTAMETLEQSKLPLVVRFVQWGCLVVGLGLAVGIGDLLIEEELPFLEAYQDVPWLFWGAGICLAIGILLTVWSFRKEKSTLESDETQQVFNNLGNAGDAVFMELGVPSHAKEVDLLSFRYKEKGDGIKVCGQGLLENYTYVTAIFQVFADENFLYLADMDGKYAIPRSGLQTIETVKKAICLDCWNKEEDYNKGKYKPYKLKETKYGEIICKPYHILRVLVNGEEWDIYFPCYELPVFEKILGITAEKNE